MLAIAPFAKGGLGIAGLAFFLFHNLLDKYIKPANAKIKISLVPKGQAKGKKK
jgi:hypothetical protein